MRVVPSENYSAGDKKGTRVLPRAFFIYAHLNMKGDF
jgi:hypothetical protein